MNDDKEQDVLSFLRGVFLGQLADTNRRNEMTYIHENRSVKHDAGPDLRFQLKEFLMQEVNRAWAENNPCGEISCKWNEESVHVIVKDGDEVLSFVTFDVKREPKGLC